MNPLICGQMAKVASTRHHNTWSVSDFIVRAHLWRVN